MSEDNQTEKAPSELRTMAENAAVMGVVTGLALITIEKGGGGWDLFAGMMVISTGMLLKAKTAVDVYHRSTRQAETNSEYLQKIAEAVRRLVRKQDEFPEYESVAEPNPMTGD